ncbi:hypothetical protein Tco_0166406 [Tanacetum coccineum]
MQESKITLLQDSEQDAGKKHTNVDESGALDNGGQDKQATRNEFESEFESTIINTTDLEDNAVDENVVIGCSHDPNIPELEDIGIFGGAYNDEDFVVEGDMNNLESSMTISPIATIRVHKVHPVK